MAFSRFRRLLIATLFPAFLALSLLAACSRQAAGQGSPAAAEPLEQQAFTGSAWHVAALLNTGENPIWFELGPDGPVHIGSPAAATLTPYVPWPHARHVTSIQLWDGFIVMPVNRDGFLVLGTAEGLVPAQNASAQSTSGRSAPAQGASVCDAAAILYRVTGAGFWEPYTAESCFIWDGKPAMLLYRNDFFAEPAAASPSPQVYALDPSSPYPLPVRVPALESIPPGWETEVIHQSPDGLWYYRVKEKGKAQNGTAYFRAMNLSKEGERISDTEWRNSISPEPPALPFLLPSLPEGFVYTGAALLGNTLAASWEEQQMPSIGAAGFMVMHYSAP